MILQCCSNSSVSAGAWAIEWEEQVCFEDPSSSEEGVTPDPLGPPGGPPPGAPGALPGRRVPPRGRGRPPGSPGRGVGGVGRGGGRGGGRGRRQAPGDPDTQPRDLDINCAAADIPAGEGGGVIDIQEAEVCTGNETSCATLSDSDDLYR